MPTSPCRARRRVLASLCEGGVKTFGFDGGRDVIRSFLSPSQRFALPAPSQRGPRNHTAASLFAAAFALKYRRTNLYRGGDQRQRRRRGDDPFDRTTKSNLRDRAVQAADNNEA